MVMVIIVVFVIVILQSASTGIPRTMSPLTTMLIFGKLQLKAKFRYLRKRQQCKSEILRAFTSLWFLQDPNSIKPFDVVVFEAHGKVPKMEQAMWPRHCVQVE